MRILFCPTPEGDKQKNFTLRKTTIISQHLKYTFFFIIQIFHSKSEIYTNLIEQLIIE